VGGCMTLLYLLLSQVFFTGYLHPYCLGWVLGISHFHGRKKYQPTASHYGWLINLTTFNAGLHVEHHDIAGIPWFRLWKMREMAPEFFEPLEQIHSYTKLGMQFVFAGKETFEDNFNTETYRNLERFADAKKA
jgi:sphingolipid delta-4 desaturase